ncbi:MAG: tetratricopeptide repeat protein [Bdellovibrionales bacterium]
MSQAAKLLQTAIAHHKAERFQDAEKAYRKFLRGNDTNADGLRLLGALYLQTGQKALAAEFLEKAARLLPHDPETLTNLGIALRNLTRQEEAVTRFKQALAHRADYIPALRNLGSLYYEIGRMGEAESSYERVLRLSPKYAPAHFDYGNSLLSLGKINEAIAQYEYALKLNPDYLEAIINLGIAFSLAGKNDLSQQWRERAQALFEKALAADPDNTVAMNNLGNILRQQGKAEEAAAYYKKALSLRPDYAEAAINLGTALRDLCRSDEAIESCRFALTLRPDSAEARINLGTFLQEKGQHDEALALFTEALQRKPSSIDAKWNKALSLLALGQYKEGWQLHEIGLGVPHMRGDHAEEKRWKGEDLKGKRLLIRSEQGLGDTMQFVRYAEMCKAQGAVVIVVCQPALRRLLSNCPFIDDLPEKGVEPDFDYHVPMMSLPYMFGTDLDSIPAKIPYLRVGDAARAQWADKFANARGFKVGLVWSGNPREKLIAAHLTDKRRSMDLQTLMPLFDAEGIQFFSLQKGAKTDQIKACGLQDKVTDFMSDVEDFEDTAAIIEHLDLVISVDTSVAHLAGGMGKSVWILSRFDACWRWLQNRPDNPWYPTARVFGQKSAGDWGGVIEDVRIALNNIS